MPFQAGLKIISVDEFIGAITAGDHPEAGRRMYYISDAWYRFHMVFRGRGRPLKYVMAGECMHPGCRRCLDEICENQRGCYLGLASPETVAEVVEALKNVTRARLEQWYAEEGLDGCDSDLEYFDELTAAWTDAAADGKALQIIIG